MPAKAKLKKVHDSDAQAARPLCLDLAEECLKLFEGPMAVRVRVQEQAI